MVPWPFNDPWLVPTSDHNWRERQSDQSASVQTPCTRPINRTPHRLASLERCERRWVSGDRRGESAAKFPELLAPCRLSPHPHSTTSPLANPTKPRGLMASTLHFALILALPLGDSCAATRPRVFQKIERASIFHVGFWRFLTLIRFSLEWRFAWTAVASIWRGDHEAAA